MFMPPLMLMSTLLESVMPSPPSLSKHDTCHHQTRASAGDDGLAHAISRLILVGMELGWMECVAFGPGKSHSLVFYWSLLVSCWYENNVLRWLGCVQSWRG